MGEECRKSNCYNRIKEKGEGRGSREKSVDSRNVSLLNNKFINYLSFYYVCSGTIS